MPEESLFENACLLHWQAKCWSGIKALPQVQVDALCSNPLPDWFAFKGKKHLVAQEYLELPKAIVRAMRKEIRGKCLPFPISSVRLVPRISMAILDAKLRVGREEFQQAVQTIEDTYENAIQEAENFLGQHFFRSDYPRHIADKYAMEWNFYFFPGSGSGSLITAEEYEGQRRQFADMMDDIRELAVAALRKEFADIVAHLVRRLTPKADGTRMVIRHDMFDRFQAFFAEFHNRNIFQDDELTRLVEHAQSILSGVSGENLGEEAWLGDEVAASLSGIKEQIDEALIAEPKRRIRYSEHNNQ